MCVPSQRTSQGDPKKTNESKPKKRKPHKSKREVKSARKARQKGRLQASHWELDHNPDEYLSVAKLSSLTSPASICK